MKNKFEKGDYIVLLSSKHPKDVNFPINFCYKISYDSSYLTVENDAKGGENGWSILPFDKSQRNDWRYASPQEIQEYDKNNRPFDVTKITTSYDRYEIY